MVWRYQVLSKEIKKITEKFYAKIQKLSFFWTEVYSSFEEVNTHGEKEDYLYFYILVPIPPEFIHGSQRKGKNTNLMPRLGFLTFRKL